MRDWKEELRRQIDRACEEIRATAFDVISAPGLITGATIEIVLDPDTTEAVRYRIETLPAALLKGRQP